MSDRYSSQVAKEKSGGNLRAISRRSGPWTRKEAWCSLVLGTGVSSSRKSGRAKKIGWTPHAEEWSSRLKYTGILPAYRRCRRAWSLPANATRDGRRGGRMLQIDGGEPEAVEAPSVDPAPVRRTGVGPVEELFLREIDDVPAHKRAQAV